MEESLEILVGKANSGDKKSLEEVVLAINDFVYNLSLKMLLFPEDAKDATQEILIKVITHLSTFNQASKFTTWVYRVATNYLLTFKGKKSKEFAMSFENYAELIDNGHSEVVRYAKNDGELLLLEEEVKVSCTQGLLLCLNPSDRIVYILSEILEFNSIDGAEIMQIKPENFRKKLSRSRTKIRGFLSQKCGLANPDNPCRCRKKIDYLVEKDIVDPSNVRFASITKRSIDLVEQLGKLEKTVAIYRSVPKIKSPKSILKEIQRTLKFG